MSKLSLLPIVQIKLDLQFQWLKKGTFTVARLSVAHLGTVRFGTVVFALARLRSDCGRSQRSGAGHSTDKYFHVFFCHSSD